MIHEAGVRHVPKVAVFCDGGSRGNPGPAAIGAVVLDPSFNWGPDPRVQGPQFNILGLPKDGTCAEQVLVPAQNLHRKPATLSWDEAAAVPLTSVTASACARRAGGLLRPQRNQPAVERKPP